MRENIEERAIELAKHIIANKSTVRSTAQHFGISKSTVHKDLTERLQLADRLLFLQVKELLEYNKSQRHIRGGIATRKKYKGE
ncbi:MAG: sporulation transcriptional regulator SpoIIID [Oscillospiraceae bacterium]